MRLWVVSLVCFCSLNAQQFEPLRKVIADTPKFDMAITLLPDSHRMQVAGTLRLPTADAPRDLIELELSDLMGDVKFELVEPAASAGSMRVTKGAKKEDDEKFVRWKLRPEHAIAANAPVLIRFSYLGAGQAFVFYLGPEGSYAGGSNTKWYPQFEGNARGCGKLSFTVPAGYSVLATGKNIGGDGVFVYENDVPSQFSFAAAKYQVFRREGVVPIRAYLFKARANVDDYLDGCAAVLALLQKKFGKYPFAEFAIAEVATEKAHDTGFSGASMNSFMLADSEDLDTPFNLAYYGHEISHQWWGNVVSNNGDQGNFMLDEAMAQFGSLQVVDEVAGTVAAEEYRRTGYPGYISSQCGYSYLRNAESGSNLPLGHLKGADAHELADSKGFLVWDLLASTVGRERFDAVLRSVTQDYAFQSIRWDEFLARTQKASGQDLGWFYRQWFEQAGAPNWETSWKQTAGTVKGAVTQAEPFYRATLEIELRGVNAERLTQILTVDGARTEFEWRVPFQVREIALDPHFKVLHWTPELRAQALARGPALKADSLFDQGKLDEAEALLRKQLESLQTPDYYGERFWDERMLARVLSKRKNWQAAEAQFDRALAEPSRDERELPLVYWEYAKAAKELKDDGKLKWAARCAMDADKERLYEPQLSNLLQALLEQK